MAIQLRPSTAYMTKLRPLSEKRSCLSPVSASHAAVCADATTIGSAPLEFCRVGDGRPRLRRPQQARQGEGGREHQCAHRGAQETRRVAAQRELPPQLVRILDVLKGEEAQPDRAQENHQDRGDPAGREARLAQRRPAIEVPPARQERGEHGGEQQRLLEVAALQERKDDARPEQAAGRHPCRVEPPLETAGQE
jgi:hypothetical protein